MLPSRGVLLRPGRALRLPRGAAPRLTTALGSGDAGQAGRARAFGSRSAAAAAAATILRSESSSSQSLLLASRGPRAMAAGVVGRSHLGRSPVGSVAAFSLFPWRSKKPQPSEQLEGAATSSASPSSSSPSDVSSAATTTTTPAAAEPSSSSSTASFSSPSTPPSTAADADLHSAAMADPTSASAEVADLLDGAALLDLPEQIGYLKALGLDFGWGPSSMCQWALEHIHIYTGLPWWGSIIVAAVLFRAAIFLPSLTAADQSARMQQLRQNPEFKEAMAEMQRAAAGRSSGGTNRAMEMRVKTQRLQAQAGITTWKMLIPMINIPFAYGMFRLLRSMAALPVPGWEHAGLLWFTDLTVPDPYFALPIASAAIMFAIFRYNIRYMAPEQAKMMKIVQLVITPLSIFLTAKMSAGVTFLFFITSLTQMVQTWLTHQPWLRSWRGLPPMHTMMNGGQGAAASLKSPPVFRLDPKSSWQAPRTIATTAKAATPATSAPPSTVDIVKEGWDKMVGNAKEKQGASTDKAALQKASEYDRRRAAEDEEALIQRREAERQYRAMKKQLAKAEANATASASSGKTAKKPAPPATKR